MSQPTYTRPLLSTLIDRLREERRFMQVLLGPRQVGKTTHARQAIERLRSGFCSSALPHFWSDPV